MGHTRLGQLPDTVPWRRVVGLLADGDSVDAVAAATIDAASKGLSLAHNDDGLRQSFWYLAQIARCAESKEFVKNLRSVGLAIPDSPSLVSIAASMIETIDDALVSAQHHTDVSEIAQLAAAESLIASCKDALPTLHPPSVSDLQAAIAKCSKKKGFGILGQRFFGRFMHRYLMYHLSRELSNHVHSNGRFTDPLQHDQFIADLKAHCHQTAYIVHDFCGQWFDKRRSSEMTPDEVKRFVPVALRKLESELKVKSDRQVA